MQLETMIFSGRQAKGLVQDCSISIDNVLEILQSYIKPLRHHIYLSNNDKLLIAYYSYVHKI